MMRTPYPILHGLLTGLLVVACGKVEEATTNAGTETDGSSGTSGDEPTTGEPGTASNTGGNSCTPGASVACTCTNGSDGAQVCAVDGKSFGECTCEGGGSESESVSSTPTTEPPMTTSGPDMTTEPDLTTGAVDMTTGDGTTTSDTTTGDVACEDPGFEPNEEENDAEDLGDNSCPAEPGNLMGVLDGDTDVDWFRFRGVDGMGCGFGDPEVSHTLTASDAVRLCVFVECDQGQDDFQCPMGTQANDSPDNRPGCCSDGDIVIDLNCSGTMTETADFFIRVDQAPADACVEYSVTFDYAAG